MAFRGTTTPASEQFVIWLSRERSQGLSTSLSHSSTSCCSVSLRRVAFRGNRSCGSCYRVRRTLTITSKRNLQFRRKPAVAGKRRLGVIGLGWVGQGFMQQAARLAQRATAGLALQAQRQLHVFQEREEAEVLLAVDDHAVPIGEQSVAGRPGATVQFLVALT